MSAKYSNSNKKKTGKKGTRIALWIVIGVLVLVLLGALLIWWALAYTESLDSPNNDGADTQLDAAQEVGKPTIGAMEDISVDLDRGLELINIGSYTGAYVEDGTNEIVSGVLMILVTNTGEEAIEYAQISIPTPDGSAEFSVSTLLPGATAVLLEQNRMAYSGQEDYAKAAADTVAVFQEIPTLCEDQLELQILDGAINVTNISGGDITGDVVIYYKNSAADLYYGGITYRVRIEGGIKAGEIKQIMASHFSASGSSIVFVTVG